MTALEVAEVAGGLALCVSAGGAFFLWVVNRVVAEAVAAAINGFKIDLALLKQSVDRLSREADERCPTCLARAARKVV